MPFLPVEIAQSKRRHSELFNWGNWSFEHYFSKNPRCGSFFPLCNHENIVEELKSVLETEARTVEERLSWTEADREDTGGP